MTATYLNMAGVGLGNKIGGPSPSMDVAAAQDGTGDIFAAWLPGQALMAARYASDSTPVWVAPAYLTLPGPPSEVRLVPMPDGKAWVLWQSLLADGDGQGIAGQRLAADGSLLGKTTVFNAITVGDQALGDTLLLPDGTWVLAYSDSSVVGGGTRIRVQRFSATGAPKGPSFLADTAAVGGATSPALASLSPDGSYLVVWNVAGSLWSRLFGLDGTPLPGIAERRVNSTTSGDQTAGHLAVGSSGGVAVFLSPDSTGGFSEVRARVFDPAGTPTGPDLALSAWAEGLHASPTISAGTAGYVAAWTAEDQDGSGDGVFARLLDAKGQPKGAAFGLTSVTKGAQTEPAVAVSSDGSWLATWTHQTATANGTDVRMRRFDSGGSALGTEATVHSEVAGLQGWSAVAAIPSGGYVVAWQSQDQDGSGLGIFVRRYSPTGTALTDDTVVNSYWSGDQRHPTLAAADDKTLLVCWESWSQDVTATWGVYCRLLNPATLAPLGDEFSPHALTGGNQWQAAVTAQAGHYAVAWTTDGLDPGQAVQLQRYDTAGKTLGVREQANRYVSGDQSAAFVAFGPDALWTGWQSAAQDGSGLGLFLRRLPVASDVPGP